jgi:hypothetical protein
VGTKCPLSFKVSKTVRSTHTFYLRISYDPGNELCLFYRIALTENEEGAGAVCYSDVEIKFLNIFWRNFVIQTYKLEVGLVRAKPRCRQTTRRVMHENINQQRNQISTGGTREQQQKNNFKQQRMF